MTKNIFQSKSHEFNDNTECQLRLVILLVHDGRSQMFSTYT